jgi:hypothetical protein
MSDYSIVTRTINSFLIVENKSGCTKSVMHTDGDILSTNVSGDVGTVLVKKGNHRKQYVYNLRHSRCTTMYSI